MANKYIIHGATYNGDGTSSAEATSNGGVGAWNSINILTGAATGYGSIAAGDVVYIRSKSAAGADLSITSASGIQIGSSVATTSAWVTWVLDDGTVWPGIVGTLSVTGTANVAQISVKTYNEIVSKKRLNWKLRTTATTANFVFVSGVDWTESTLDGISIDASAGAIGYAAFSTNGYSKHVFNECEFIGSPGFTSSQPMFQFGVGCSVAFINPKITISHGFSRIFSNPPSGAHIRIMGGELRGAGATTGTFLARAAESYGILEFIGFKYPPTVLLSDTSLSNDAWPIPIRAFGGDGQMACEVVSNGVYESARQDGYFPSLNAQLPTSVSSGWSWLYRLFETRKARPLVQTFCKMYHADPAVLTVSLELLVSSNFSAVNKNNTWISVDYVDNATGEMKTITSRVEATSALDTSTASWTATTYGAVLLNKRKLSVVLPTAAKKDRTINVTFVTSAKQASSNDLIFVCPDPVIV